MQYGLGKNRKMVSHLQIRDMVVSIDSEGDMCIDVDRDCGIIYLLEGEAKQLRDWLMANVYLMEKRNAPTGE